jgi:E3 ubiquitin-protein ligase SHPRH
VTGTPINRSLDDIYGLMLFLGARPFDSKTVWSNALAKPYIAKSRTAIERAHRFLSEIMWRTHKEDVVDQISIPPQTEEVLMLKFNSVEAHFYRKQHRECAQAAFDLINESRRTGRKNLDDAESIR